MNDTECRIKWLDDLSEMDVTIRATEYENDLDDDQIFFYGLSREDCIRRMESGQSELGEWIILEVY